MRDTKNRSGQRELDIQLTLLETEPVPPERLKEGLRVLANWLTRVSRQEDGTRGKTAESNPELT